MPFTPPQIQRITDILPEEPLLLMGSGPVPVPHVVARANMEVINHLGPTMNAVIKNVKRMGQYVFQTKNEKIFGVSGPSSACMEMAVSNLCWPGRKVLVLRIGTFSGRFLQMATGVGADVTVLDPVVENQPISVERLADALKKDHYDVVTMVQGETSCGMVNAQLPEKVRLCKEHGALVITDAVCTLTTMKMYMDDWGIDVLLTGGQKGLSSIPGVSLICFSDAAWQVVLERKVPMPHWCLDAKRAWGFWGEHNYHYTAPVSGILALHEALRLICEETLERRWKRHKICSTALQAGLEKMGLELLMPAAYRLRSVVAINLPKGVPSAEMRKYMAETFHVEIAGAFGLDIVRIGQMGEQCRSQNLFKTLYALGVSMNHFGANVDVAAGMAAMEDALTPSADFVID